MGGEEFSEGAFGGGTLGSGTTFDQLLRGLRRAPTYDLVMANLHLFRNNGSEIRRSNRKATGAVVNGMVLVEVMGDAFPDLVQRREHLLFQCGPGGGVRLLDVKNPKKAKLLGAVNDLPGGTHTLTVYPGTSYIYASPGGTANGDG